MRRDRFVEQYRQYRAMMFNRAKKRLSYDDAQEMVAQVIRRIVEQKTYTRITADKLESFLVASVSFATRKFVTEQKDKHVRLDIIREDAPDSQTYTVPEQVDAPMVECPFCFHGNLNRYGGCILCRTIVPSRMTVHRRQLHLEELSLSITVDYDKSLDIQHAIASLTPKEQRVVKAIGLGNESLESLADIEHEGRQALWRVWLSAKAKLQERLKEYAENPLSKTVKWSELGRLQVIDNM